MSGISDFSKSNERNLHVIESDTQPHHSRGDLINAAIGLDIRCDQSIFDSYSYEGWQDIHHDLLIVCAAIEYADRRWARSAKHWARRLNVTIPVLKLATWLDSNVQKNLHSTLGHLTGDEWRLSFVQYNGPATKAGRQRPLFPNQQKEFAIAFSEGLDSLCVSGLHNENDSAVCVRVAKNQQRLQKDEQPFDRLPFYVNVKPSAEDSVRSRGFKFAAITAIASHLSKISRIIVPESGQGALGPVLLPLRNIYPDYRNHPTFFRQMERFIYALLGIEVRYEQPRLWYTKGQTVSAFLAKPWAKVEQVINTRSCWQQRANVRVGGKLRQCGICAACLLRRMSLHTAGVHEPPEKYTISDLTKENFTDALPKIDGFNATATLHDYGYMGARHLQQLADLAGETDAVLRPYAFELTEALDTTMDDVQKSLRNMLCQHSQEWSSFSASQGANSFLKFWIQGGRNG